MRIRMTKGFYMMSNPLPRIAPWIWWFHRLKSRPVKATKGKERKRSGTWLYRGSYGVYMVVTGSTWQLRGLRGTNWYMYMYMHVGTAKILKTETFCYLDHVTARRRIIDLMHWRHGSMTTTPCWGSRLVAHARTCCVGRARWCSQGLSASQSVRGPAPPAVWHAWVGLLAACLAMAHVAVLRLTPNTRERPSVTSYAYGLLPHRSRNCHEVGTPDHSMSRKSPYWTVLRLRVTGITARFLKRAPNKMLKLIMFGSVPGKVWMGNSPFDWYGKSFPHILKCKGRFISQE